MGTNDEDRCGLAAATSNPTSMAGQAVCRQTPEVGAECVNCACSDLCGGRSVMGVPTAIPWVHHSGKYLVLTHGQWLTLMDTVG